MNEPIDLTGEEKAGAAAMEIDTINPIENITAQRLDLNSSTAAPALGPHAATTAPPAPAAAPVPAPHNGLAASANDLRLSQREKKPSMQRVLMDKIGEQPQHLRMNRRNGKISIQDMQAHLDTISIGLRPSDPTVIDLPDELPPPMHPANCTPSAPEIEVINLSEWTQERLNALAATTVGKDPFTGVLLEEPPPAAMDRLGRFTGQQQNRERIIRVAKATRVPSAPVAEKQIEREVKKKEKKVVSVAAPMVAAPAPPPAPAPATTAPAMKERGRDVTPAERIATLHKYISVGEHVPWTLLGKAAPLKAGGVTVHVLTLWTAVEKFGGFSAVAKQKLWSAVAREFGLDTRTFHDAHVLRDAYAKYLLPYEVYLRHKSGGG